MNLHVRKLYVPFATAVIVSAVVAGCGGGGGKSAKSPTVIPAVPTSIVGAPQPTVTGETHQLADGLSYIDVKQGTGAEAAQGDKVQVLYDMYANGLRVGGTEGSGPTLSFTIGQRDAIAGIEEGAVSMKVGGRRRLMIPAALAFGDKGIQDNHQLLVLVPPNTPIVVDMTLVSVKG
jgi:FKBP-type peptidyl-prolyl cis-trans isomerase